MSGKIKTVVVDIDGTIARVHPERLAYIQQEKPNWDKFYDLSFKDKPIEPIVDLVQSLMSNYQIVFCTGRRESIRITTEKWLQHHFRGINFPMLLMRGDKDYRHDIDVKPELLKNALLTPNRVAFCLEDRNVMVKKWREMGYTCLQVAEGDF